ncbi:MAG TPA: hypothetical protein VFV63_00265 [Ilumatobacteraceae bacterium]|nr:hypothetical protein [Ilumatobacteraceae bacterium]
MTHHYMERSGWRERFSRKAAERRAARQAESLKTPCQRYYDTFDIKSDRRKRYLVHNRTPKQIRIVDDTCGELVLPPLAQRVIMGSRLAPFRPGLYRLRQGHQLRVRAYHRPYAGPRIASALISMAVAVLIGIVINAVLEEGTLERREVFVSAAITVGLILLVLGVAACAEWRRRESEQIADADEGDIEFGMGGAFYDGNESLRRIQHIFTLLTVVMIGAVLPAIAIFVASDAKDFLVMNGGLDVVDGKESRLVGRIIQVLYTAVLSLFPAILYFQFDRHRVGTIRTEWVRAIFRMDKRMETLADVNARYGDELAEASSYSTDSVRLLGGRNSPIVIATLLISLGWTLLVVQTDSFDFAGSSEIAVLAQTADAAADRANAALVAIEDGSADPDVGAATARSARDEATLASEEAALVADSSVDGDEQPTPTTAAPVGDGANGDSAREAAAAAAAAAERAALDEARVDQPFFQFLVPTPSAAAMAFLGAYFFGAYLILRSFYRGDLRPKVYNQITARLITVVVLAYLIQTIFYNEETPAVWALSFLAGVVPTTVLQHVVDLASSLRIGSERSPSEPDAPITRRQRLGRSFAEAFPTRRSLTQLDGVDVHDSTRLETEGITDVPSLATADLVSVMVSTRLPIDRLVDWMDQAVLILLLDDDANQELDSRVKRLRRIGIRTASGVLAANDGELGDDIKNAATDIIASTPDGAPSDANSLAGLAAEIRREPAMLRVLQWRHSELAAVDKRCPTITIRNNVVEPTQRERGSTPVVAPTRPAEGHTSRVHTPSNPVLSGESPRSNGHSARHPEGAMSMSAASTTDTLTMLDRNAIGSDVGETEQDDPLDDPARGPGEATGEASARVRSSSCGSPGSVRSADDE